MISEGYGMQELQHNRQRYFELSDELQRAYEREIMCLQRAQAAHRRALQQDFMSFCEAVAQAIFYGGDWPWAESLMWDAYVKRASRYVRSVEKELEALEKYIRPDLFDPASLEAIFGPLVEDTYAPGSEITLAAEDGQVKQVLIHWVFKDHNGENWYVTSASQPMDVS